jgi:acetyl-CoA carboxylase biotin carboxyl carrier protein
MDIRKVKKLIELLEESGISEIEIREGEESVRISRGGNVMMQPAPAVFTPAMHPNTTVSPPSTTISKPENHTEFSHQERVIKAPMVGTFYRSSGPNDKPFVEIGSSIKVGSILCIVEAMKMLNQIEAEHAGTIKSILVENGQPIEFGQPLFIISDR